VEELPIGITLLVGNGSLDEPDKVLLALVESLLGEDEIPDDGGMVVRWWWS